MKRIVFSLFLFVAAMGASGGRAEELILAAGPSGGDIAGIGSTLARIMSEGKTSIRTIDTKGDPDSIADLYSGSADLAVVDSLSAYEASMGMGRFSSERKRKPLAAAVVGLLVEHFLLVGSPGQHDDVAVLSDKILYLGPDDDPETYASRTIIGSLGISSYYGVGSEWDYTTASELMVDGTFDGAVFSGIVPVHAVSHVMSIMGGHVRLLEVSPEGLERIRGQWPIWFPYVVPEKTYPSVEKPYETIARPILLLAAQKLDGATVEALLTRLFDNSGNLKSAGPSYKVTSSMTPAFCPIKFHPGAADYFKEHGR